MNIDTDKLVEILTGVLNAPARSPALQPLARVKYPGRELGYITEYGGGSPFVCISLGTSISTGGQYLKNYPSSALPPCKRLSTTHSRTASP